MNKNFEEPKHEIIHLSNTDVIAASSSAEPSTPSGGSGIGDIISDILNK